MSDKPTTAGGYRREDTQQVVAACLTLAAALGDLADELCIVGGLVPSMICDTEADPSALADGAHVGTNDLDVALQVTVLDDEHYKEISARLRNKGRTGQDGYGGDDPAALALVRPEGHRRLPDSSRPGHRCRQGPATEPRGRLRSAHRQAARACVP